MPSVDLYTKAQVDVLLAAQVAALAGFEPAGTAAAAVATQATTDAGRFDAAGAAAAQATTAAATYSTLAQLAASPDLLAVGAITRSSTGAATSFGVAWPDGATGTFTGTESTSFPGAIDAYTLTKVKSGTTTTFTQPALTRDSSGSVTNRPAITVN